MKKQKGKDSKSLDRTHSSVTTSASSSSSSSSSPASFRPKRHEPMPAKSKSVGGLSAAKAIVAQREKQQRLEEQKAAATLPPDLAEAAAQEARARKAQEIFAQGTVAHSFQNSSSGALLATSLSKAFRERPKRTSSNEEKANKLRIALNAGDFQTFLDTYLDESGDDTEDEVNGIPLKFRVPVTLRDKRQEYNHIFFEAVVLCAKQSVEPTEKSAIPLEAKKAGKKSRKTALEKITLFEVIKTLVEGNPALISNPSSCQGYLPKGSRLYSILEIAKQFHHDSLLAVITPKLTASLKKEEREEHSSQDTQPLDAEDSAEQGEQKAAKKPSQGKLQADSFSQLLQQGHGKEPLLSPASVGGKKGNKRLREEPVADSDQQQPR